MTYEKTTENDIATTGRTTRNYLCDVIVTGEEDSTIGVKTTWKDSPIQGDHVHATSYRHVSLSTPPVKYFLTRGECPDFESHEVWGSVSGVPDAPMSFVSDTGQPIWDGNTRNRVEVECLAKLGEGKINIGVSVAEAVQTANGVIDIATDTLKALAAIKKGDVKSLRRIFGKEPIGKSVASRWLQYRLGVVPMLSDLKAAGDLHDAGIEDRSREGKPLEIMATRSLNRYTTATSANGTNHSVSETYRCSIGAVISDASEHGLQKLGLNDLKGVIWELIPLSFVYDYMVPIGTMIAAYNAPVGLTFQKGHTSLRISEIMAGERQILLSSSPIGDPVKTQATAQVFERQAMGAFQSVKPYIKNPLSVIHGANVLALLVQARK